MKTRSIRSLALRVALYVAFVIALFDAAPEKSAAASRDIEDLKRNAPPLVLHPASPERFELKNGIRVYFLHNDRLPLVTVRAVIRTGAIWEPNEKRGVAELTGRMMRSGGAGEVGPDAFDERLDFLATELNTDIETEEGSATLSCLADQLGPSLTLFADVLRRPLFDEGKLAVQKNLVKEEIRREKDSPIQVALVEYAKLLWGVDHPRARRPTESSVDALTRADLVDFHARFFRPSNVMIGVAGDVKLSEMKKLLETAFGDWKGEAVQFPELPAPPAVLPRVALAEKSVTQSTVLLGQLGPKEDDPHRASGQVMMQILASGGFTSYVVDRIRNDEGLAYAAGGILRFGRIDPGVFVLFALSKSESTCRATDLLLEQIDRIRSTPVTDEELLRARDGILNSRAFDFDSSEKIVRDFMDLVYYGLPEDHSERILEAVGAVTKEEVQGAARAILDPERLTMLVVGEPSKLDCAWSRYAERLGVPLTEIPLEKTP